MRKVNIDDAHDQSKVGKRQSLMELSKGELIYMIERSNASLRFKEEETDKMRERWLNTDDNLRAEVKRRKENDKLFYEQMDTAIGAMYEQARKMPDASRFSYAMLMVRALQVMIIEFHYAKPDLRRYEHAASRYATDTFYSLCQLAKFIPKPSDEVVYTLYRRCSDEEEVIMNAYEYTDIYDIFVDEVLPPLTNPDFNF